MILKKLKAFNIPEDGARVNALRQQIVEAHRQSNLRDNLTGFVLYYERLNLSYTYIPKNACGYLKFNFGMANGTMNTSVDVHAESEKRLTHSWYPHLMATKIIVLRNPFQRTISAFLNKISRQTLEPPARQVCALIFKNQRRMNDKEVDQHLESGVRPSFAEFVTFLGYTPDKDLDCHWRSQCTFFTFEKYDKIFALETLDADWPKSGLNHIQMVEGWGNPTTRGNKIVREQKDLGISSLVPYAPGEEIQRLMTENGTVPATPLFFNCERALQIFKTRFADDLFVFESLFPSLIQETSGMDS
jgi:hypothetical protein